VAFASCLALKPLETKKTMKKVNKEGFIPTHGGYRNLFSYRKAEIIYDGTVYFTNRFFHKYDRTIGQMVQAARSGKQNIAEGSMPRPPRRKQKSYLQM
jgi:hypothetical protein